jgi:hypothetical protein
MVYTKVVVLNIDYNFIVEIFFYLKSFRILDMYSNFIDFEIQKFRITIRP